MLRILLGKRPETFSSTRGEDRCFQSVLPSLQDLSQESKRFSHHSRYLGSILRFAGHAYHGLCSAVPDENPGAISVYPQPELCLNRRIFPKDPFQTVSHFGEFALGELSSISHPFSDHMVFRNIPYHF